MTIRNSKLGGQDFQDGEVLYDYDLDDTFNAIQYELKAQNNVPVTQTDNGTSTISVNIPSGSVIKYIEISSFVKASSTINGGSANSASVRLYKSYNSVDTDLISTHIFLEDSDSTAKVTNGANSYIYYYEPTVDEKTNGFTISIDISFNISNVNDYNSGYTTCEYINIMGV